MKFIVRTIVLLLVINGLLLSIHYSQSGKVAATDSKTQTYTQEIEVTNRPDGLHVRQHFRGLSEARHEIRWPEASIDRSCYMENATSCARFDESATAFIEGDVTEQSITYVLPKQAPMEQMALFKAPFASLHGFTVSSTAFHLSDETGLGGLWVTGLKQIGTKKIDLMTYAYFKGSGGVTDLYWQKEEEPFLYSGDKLAVYSKETDTTGLEDVDAALQRIGADYSTVVINERQPLIQAERFIVSNATSVEQLSDLFLITNMRARFSIPQNEQLVAEAIASIIGEKPSGSEKTHNVVGLLADALTAEEMELLRTTLLETAGQSVDATVLDDMIGKVTGFKTSFFKRNSQEGTALSPFLLEDTRQVRLEGKADPDSRVILKNGKTFYPAQQMLSQLGYSVTSNEQSIYIETDSRVFRFPKKELFYVYNDRKYNVATNPFEVMENDFYFEEEWFQRLFLLSIEKTDEAIEIVRISKLIEGSDSK